MARREPGSVSFPSSPCKPSAVSFIKLVFLISSAPLCQHKGLCWGVLSSVGDKDTSELAQKGGRATGPCVGAGGGRGCRMLRLPAAAAHTNNVSPSAAGWGRKLLRCFSPAAGPGRVDLRAAGCWGQGLQFLSRGPHAGTALGAPQHLSDPKLLHVLCTSSRVPEKGCRQPSPQCLGSHWAALS